MKQFCCYNKETGTVYMQMTVSDIIKDNFDTIIINVDGDKEFNAINPETKEPIYERTLESRIAALEASQNDQDEAIVELADTIYGEE